MTLPDQTLATLAGDLIAVTVALPVPPTTTGPVVGVDLGDTFLPLDPEEARTLAALLTLTAEQVEQPGQPGQIEPPC